MSRILLPMLCALALLSVDAGAQEPAAEAPVEPAPEAPPRPPSRGTAARTRWPATSSSLPHEPAVAQDKPAGKASGKLMAVGHDQQCTPELAVQVEHELEDTASGRRVQVSCGLIG